MSTDNDVRANLTDGQEPISRRPSPRPRTTDQDEAPASPFESENRTEATDDKGFSLFPWLGEMLSRYWTPPKLWGEAPASLEDLSTYAHRGEWTGKTGGPRFAGIWYWRLIGLPITAICRRLEFVAQRPGRLITVLVVFVLVGRSTYGHTALSWIATPLGWLAWLAGF
ncbi:hypothetical protein [Micromonospora sp. NPDC049662]|uniref:hypothetical protein n=1 Tax=Micromonospora sp. NPDC049662 TaxID=3155397 RepID=UPI00342F8737